MVDLTNVVILSIFEIFGDFQFQEYANTTTATANYKPLLLGILGYIGVVVYLIKSLRDINILYVNLLWDGTSAIIESLAAIFILGQTFKSYTHMVGAAFIILGIYIIKYK
jgi:multidrug transporter EmrE-like cation transporter